MNEPRCAAGYHEDELFAAWGVEKFRRFQEWATRHAIDLHLCDFKGWVVDKNDVSTFEWFDEREAKASAATSVSGHDA